MKTKQEAEKLYDVVFWSDKLMTSCTTNQEYLSSPYLESMRKAAGEAFTVFMENEKDNKEFCEFITVCKAKNQKAINTVDAGRELVNSYTESMLKQRYEHYIKLHIDAINLMKERLEYHKKHSNQEAAWSIQGGIVSLERDVTKIINQGLDSIRNIIRRGPPNMRKFMFGSKAYFLKIHLIIAMAALKFIMPLKQ